jgi:hypothetical protein
MSLVVTLVDFLVDTSVTTGLDEQYQEALMTHGIVRHLTAAICGLALNGKLKLGRYLGLLAQRLWATAAHSLFGESFQGGLLREIMLSALVADETINELLSCYLTEILPPLVIYHSVLFARRPDWANHEELVASHAFRDSQIFP